MEYGSRRKHFCVAQRLLNLNCCRNRKGGIRPKPPTSVSDVFLVVFWYRYVVPCFVRGRWEIGIDDCDCALGGHWLKTLPCCDELASVAPEKPRRNKHLYFWQKSYQQKIYCQYCQSRHFVDPCHHCRLLECCQILLTDRCHLRRLLQLCQIHLNRCDFELCVERCHLDELEFHHHHVIVAFGIVACRRHIVAYVLRNAVTLVLGIFVVGCFAGQLWKACRWKRILKL